LHKLVLMGAEMKRLAFTMIELVMAIVVLGILAAVAIPKLDNDIRVGARDNIYSALQYTRQLALVDNKTNPTDDEWQQELWAIRFSSDGDGGFTYSIFSNSDHGLNVDLEESAIDPANGKYLFARAGRSTPEDDESPSVFLGQEFGINEVDFVGGCRGTQTLAFDHLGRPHVGGIFTKQDLYSQVMTTDCTITIGFEDEDIEDLTFIVSKETGFVRIL